VAVHCKFPTTLANFREKKTLESTKQEGSSYLVCPSDRLFVNSRSSTLFLHLRYITLWCREYSFTTHDDKCRRESNCSGPKTYGLVRGCS